MTALIEIDENRLRVGMVKEYDPEYQELAEMWDGNAECKIFEDIYSAQKWVSDENDKK